MSPGPFQLCRSGFYLGQLKFAEAKKLCEKVFVRVCCPGYTDKQQTAALKAFPIAACTLLVKKQLWQTHTRRFRR